MSSRDIHVVVVVPRTSTVHAVRIVAEYAVTIGVAVLLSYLILGGHW